MRKLALYWQILIGMLLGVILGLALSQFSWGSSFVQDWIKPFGNIFINSLKLIAIPLILGSLIKGISDLKDISQLSSIGLKTISLYILSTLVAVSVGLTIVNVISPGKHIAEETRTELVTRYADDAVEKQTEAQRQQESGPLQALEDIVPENIFGAAADNTNMLQIIFFAIFFGIGMILIPEKQAKPVKKFFDSFNHVILKLIDIIMLAAPYGVFALLTALVTEAPSGDLFVALGMYAFSVLLGLATMIALYTLVVWGVTKRPPGFFIKGIAPAQLLGFSTSSSAATLPLTMERVEDHLGVDESIASFV